MTIANNTIYNGNSKKSNNKSDKILIKNQL